MQTLNRPSFNEIGEMTCITHAWLSPGETLKYLPGREMVTADALSRLSPVDEFEIPDMNVKFII